MDKKYRNECDFCLIPTIFFFGVLNAAFLLLIEYHLLGILSCPLIVSYQLHLLR